MKTGLFLYSLLAVLISGSAIADDYFTVPASPLSMNTFNSSLRKQFGIVDTIYRNPEFQEKMNLLREKIGRDRALMVTGYAASNTPAYAFVTLRLAIYELGGEMRDYGELGVQVSRSNTLQVFKLVLKR